MASLVLLFSEFLHPEDALLVGPRESSSSASAGACRYGERMVFRGKQGRRSTERGPEDSSCSPNSVEEVGEMRFSVESIWP